MDNENIHAIGFIPNRKINFILILSLFLLRLGIGFFVLAGDIYFSIAPFYDMFTYFLSALFIWLNRDSLEKFNIDTLAISIFWVFRSLLWIDISQFSYKFLTFFINCIIALVLVISLVKSGRYKLSNIKASNIRWFIVGTILGILIGWFLFSLEHSLNGISGNRLIILFIIGFISSMSIISIAEEPLFRGFLWGHLRDLGWNERRILFIQAFLFWIVHFYYWNRFPFIILVPLLGIFFGVLAKHSKSIATSMAAHAGINAFNVIGALLKF
jgi:membrane protease YdiL (CAAX protease family)